MKTDKIIQKTTQSVINQVQSTPVQRVKLEQKPDIVDIPKKKQTFWEMPVEKLEELKPQLGENFDLVKRYQAAVVQGQDTENAFLKEAADKDYKIFFEEFKNFRAKVVDEMGIIPANSKDAEKSKELFDSILGANQNALTSAKTIIRPHEIDAYMATGFSYWEFMLARFIK